MTEAPTPLDLHAPFGQLYGRKCSLVVTAGSKGLDLSELRIQFLTTAPDTNTPPNAIIRVSNLSDATANQIEREFQRVMLQAGYEHGNYGVIFQGQIKQVRRGRDANAVDTFVDIMASDGDQMMAYGVVNKTLAPGATMKDMAAAVGEAAKPYGVSVDEDSLDVIGTGGANPAALRTTTLFGMLPNVLDSIANTTQTSWSIRDGKIVFSSLTGYDPGEIIELSPATGLVGVPEAQLDGIHVRTLLNVNVKTGRRVRISGEFITRTTVREQGFPSLANIATMFPSVDRGAGVYRVYEVAHSGDTRGDTWYTDVIALSVDPSAQVNQSVAAYGG